MSRYIDADALLTDRKKSKYYHLPNGDIAIPTPNALYVGCALPLICPKCRARMRNGGIPTR